MLSGDKTLYGEYEHVYSGDPAIDRESPDYDPEKYADTGDRKWMPKKNGSDPATFKLEHIGGKARAYVIDQINKLGMVSGNYEALAYALVGVENILLGGKPVELKRAHTALGWKRLTDESLRDLELACGKHWPQVIGEVGSRALMEAVGSGK